jgi:hypothetical protein
MLMYILSTFLAFFELVGITQPVVMLKLMLKLHGSLESDT